MAKLGDICSLYSGTGFPVQYQGNTDGQFPFYKVGDIAKNVIQGFDFLAFCDNHIEEDICKKIKGTVIPENTVVFAKIGEAVKLNRRAITSVPCLIDNNAMGIKPDESKIDLRYFYHFMCNLKLEEYAEATTVPSVKKSIIEKIDIPLPPLKIQKQIAATLDKVTALIDKHKRQLALLDELVKSRFVELFGDPLSNDKGWSEFLITEVCQAIFGGGTPAKSHPEYFTGDIPWVSPKDMKSSVINDSIDHITEEAIAHSTTNLVPTNSVLMVIRSGILKHTLPVATNSVPVTINQDMKAFVPNATVTTAFLMHYFKAIESDVLSGVRGVTADNIDFKAFQKRSIITPPIKLQEQFAAFVTQTDKSKLAVQQSLEKLETLKKSLMQEYFG